MSRRAIVDPEELKRFAHDLDAFNRDLEDLLGGIRARFEHVSQTWEDQEFSDYSEHFKQADQTMVRFMEETSRQVSHLFRKAQRAQSYLDERL